MSSVDLVLIILPPTRPLNVVNIKLSQLRRGYSYACDVVNRYGSVFLANKDLFAMTDAGVPDHIECDMTVNDYSGCGDGVHVWIPGGSLIGKTYVLGGCANFCFGLMGEVLLLKEHRMWRARLDESGRGALLGI